MFTVFLFLNYKSFSMKPTEFNAIIQQNGEMNAAFVEFPFSTEELFSKRGRCGLKQHLTLK